MKKSISLTLIGTLAFQLLLPITAAFASDLSLSPNDAAELIAQRGSRGGGGGSRAGRSGGGARAGGSGGGSRANRSGGSMNRSHMGASGSGRVSHDRASRPSGGERRTNAGNMNLNQERSGSNRVARDGATNANRDRATNANRDQARNRAQNVDRDQARNRAQNVDRSRDNNRINNSRDFSLNNDRNYSNRINRNVINTGNRNIIVNPRGGAWGGSAWGWNRGVVWAPNYGYWGGGFWGAFAVGAATVGITSAIVNASQPQEPTIIIIEKDSPGYNLFDSYGLIQIDCIEDGSQVYIFGPQDSLICANANDLVSPGYYDVNPSDLTLVLR